MLLRNAASNTMRCVFFGQAALMVALCFWTYCASFAAASGSGYQRGMVIGIVASFPPHRCGIAEYTGSLVSHLLEEGVVGWEAMSTLINLHVCRCFGKSFCAGPSLRIQFLHSGE